MSFDFFNPNTICFLCNKKTGMNKHKTVYGYICQNCLQNLTEENVLIFNIKKYTVEELKEKIGISYKEPILVPLNNVPINLKKDEICYYEGKAKSIKIKNVVTHYESGSSGLNIKLSKNVSYRVGESKGRAVRENISEKYPGTFYITNLRVILISQKYGFDLKFDKILSIQTRSDGFIFQIGDKTYSVLSNDTDYITKLFELINNKKDNV